MILKNKKISMLGVSSDNVLSRDITKGIKKESFKNYNKKSLDNLYKTKRKLKADKNFKRFETLEHYLINKDLPITLEGFKELLKIQSNGPGKLFKKSSIENILQIFERYKFKTTTEAKRFYYRFVNLPKPSTIYITKKEFKESTSVKKNQKMYAKLSKLK